MDIQVPSNIYVGRNTVRVHLADFLQIAADRNLLSSDEQILAVFDCIIMDEVGGRLGGFTLHDYAILTNQNLIMWARGRSKDSIDKCIWPNIVIERFGRRNVIEGVLKFSYRVPISANKRRISLRAKPEDGDKAKNKAKNDNEPTGSAIVIFLDLIPLEDVQICQKMMNLLIKNPPENNIVEEFFTTFKAEIDESTARLTSVPVSMRPMYVQQPNGVYIEAGELEEERLLLSMETKQTPPASPYRGVATMKRGYASPYQLGNSNQGNASSNSNRSLNSRSSGTSGMAGYTSKSKLDAYEQGSRPVERKNNPAPTPTQPTYNSKSVDKVDKPTIPSPYQNQNNYIPPVTSRALAANESIIPPPPPVPPIREIPNIYSVSRLAHGLFEGRQNFSKSIADVSQTAAILASIPGLIAGDESTKHSSLMQLRGIFEGGYLDKNPLLGKAIMPLMQPLLSKYMPMGMMGGGGGASSTEPAQKRNRLTIRGTAEGEKTESGARPNVPFKNRQAESDSVDELMPNITQALLEELPLIGEIAGTDELENLPEVPVEKSAPEQPKRIKLGKQATVATEPQLIPEPLILETVAQEPEIAAEIPSPEQPKRIKLVKEVPVSPEPEVVPERTIVEISIPEFELPPELANPAQPKRIKLGKK
ncbi:MAG: hypothetical protein HXX08_20845 [Chloroflexi bacterium]|uniref:Uncharacterized protein n=1 Tax=Candidatus Chlorohelix allophototropha TaxID=3003348 RepID=A0A8T7M8E4_9CHLR|nr:hypothetical protein [Chloroflexota bacterium]WJW68245.1 hypothetical protein OZ401_003852 [Chloroflexota bacterium L227-S17]